MPADAPAAEEAGYPAQGDGFAEDDEDDGYKDEEDAAGIPPAEGLLKEVAANGYGDYRCQGSHDGGGGGADMAHGNGHGDEGDDAGEEGEQEGESPCPRGAEPLQLRAGIP